MNLLTKKIEEKLRKYPLGSQEGKFGDAKVITKFFNPYGSGTWYVTEAVHEVPNTEHEDWTLFGFCWLYDKKMAEFGYFSLNDLQNAKITVRIPLTMESFEGKIERDKSYDNLDITVKEACIRDFGFIPEQLKNKER